MTGWYVDLPSNSVVVEVDPRTDTAATDRFVGKAKATGMPVRIRRTARSPKPLANIADGAPFTFSEGGSRRGVPSASPSPARTGASTS